MNLAIVSRDIRQKLMQIYGLERANRENSFDSGPFYILTHKIHFKSLERNDYRFMIIFIEDHDNANIEYKFKLFDKYFDDQDEERDMFLCIEVKTGQGKTERDYCIDENDLGRYVKLQRRLKLRDLEELITCLNVILLAGS